MKAKVHGASLPAASRGPHFRHPSPFDNDQELAPVVDRTLLVARLMLYPFQASPPAEPGLLSPRRDGPSSACGLFDHRFGRGWSRGPSQGLCRRPGHPALTTPRDPGGTTPSLRHHWESTTSDLSHELHEAFDTELPTFDPARRQHPTLLLTTPTFNHLLEDRRRLIEEHDHGFPI